MAEDSERTLVMLVMASPGTTVTAVAERLGEAAVEVRDISRLGHDLASPLAIIGGVADTLGVAWDRLAEPDRARLLASIRNQVERATALLDQTMHP